MLRPFGRWKPLLVAQRQYLFKSSTARIHTPIPPLFLAEENLAASALSPRIIFRKFVRYSLGSILSITFLSALVFEGAHLWVEKVELGVDTAEEVSEWEWDKQGENWSGGRMGGTDPSLGFKGRHAVRAAWMAQNWGKYLKNGETTSLRQFKVPKRITESSIDRGYLLADEFLEMAIKTVSPSSAMFLPLSERHAALLERIGTNESLKLARDKYRTILNVVSTNDHIEVARVAQRMAEVSLRLGDGEEGVKWAKHAAQSLSSQPLKGNSESVMIPAGPFARRILVSTYAFLSTYYSMNGELSKAWSTQREALQFINTITSPVPSDLKITSNTAPSTLHSLFLHHRASVLSLQHAEVQFVLTKDIAVSLKRLLDAANTAETVVVALCGLPIQPSRDSSRTFPHSPIRQVFNSSRTLSRPANKLLRDAKRTASEAWSLCGLLYEGQDDVKALACVEKALTWAGGSLPDEERGLTEKEWTTIWNNYVRIKGKINEPSKAL